MTGNAFGAIANFAFFQTAPSAWYFVSFFIVATGLIIYASQPSGSAVAIQEYNHALASSGTKDKEFCLRGTKVRCVSRETSRLLDDDNADEEFDDVNNKFVQSF